MRPALGTVLRGKYKLVRQVDEGEAGDVFEVQHLDLAGRYAIKFLCEGGIQNTLLLDELRREALATSVLTHPGILRVYDLDQAPDGSPFIVMEYLEGRDLGRILRGPMALSDVAVIVEAIASPLEEAHRRGIFHGDLTLENVFVLDSQADAHARVKILDFGVATIRARAGGVVRGLAAPGASERHQVRESQVDARTDVLSLGAIAHALISGRAPLAATRTSSAGSVVTGLEAAPRAVAAAVARATSPQREVRFSSVIDFARALRAAVAASPRRTSGVMTTRLGPTPAVPFAAPQGRATVSVQKTLAAAVVCGLVILIGMVVVNILTPAPPPVRIVRNVARPAVAPPSLPAPVIALDPEPPVAAPVVAVRDTTRQPLPPHEVRGGELHHHHHSAHAGMTEADLHEMQESFKKATRAFDVASYDEAIVAYKRTYELGGDAPMLYNIAQALRLSERPDEAVVYYRRYLDRAPTAPNGDEVRSKIAELKGEGKASPPKVRGAEPASKTRDAGVPGKGRDAGGANN